MKLLTKFFTIGLIVVLNAQCEEKYSDFDRAMGLDNLEFQKIHEAKGQRDAQYYPMVEIFRKLFYENNESKIQPKENAIIPTVIHHVWLGSKLPVRYEDLRATWINMHPNWNYVLWTDQISNYDQGLVVNDVAELEQYLNRDDLHGKKFVIDVKNFKLRNQKLFDLSRNYGEKSDILRYEVLYHFGGLYVDTDFECVKSFDKLHHMYNFYVSLLPVYKIATLANGVIGSIKKCSFLLGCIEKLNSISGKSFLENDWQSILYTTGPMFFQGCFCQFLKNNEHNGMIAFPASYFFPIDDKQKNLGREKINKFISADTYAIHYWGCSWATPSGYVN